MHFQYSQQAQVPSEVTPAQYLLGVSSHMMCLSSTVRSTDDCGLKAIGCKEPSEELNRHVIA